MIHKRHTIRRQRIDYSKPNCFFVTICTFRGGYYFEKHPSLQKILDNNIKTIPKYFPNIRVSGYVIMPNHVHLLLHIEYQVLGVTLGMIIKSLKSKTVVDWLKYMKQHQVSDIASVWQRNYFERIIRDELEYRKVAGYIKNNRSNWENDEYHPSICKVGV